MNTTEHCTGMHGAYHYVPAVHGPLSNPVATRRSLLNGSVQTCMANCHNVGIRRSINHIIFWLGNSQGYQSTRRLIMPSRYYRSAAVVKPYLQLDHLRMHSVSTPLCRDIPYMCIWRGIHHYIQLWRKRALPSHQNPCIPPCTRLEPTEQWYK